uniref:Non-specific protein-tyrosine kinase n=1 Tax=Panagrolaimus sp. PS1159 TaxID=55785 RepID=A0AC35FT47_9BILA
MSQRKPHPFADPMSVLHHQIWYHGMRSRNETHRLFKNEGDFLVRTTVFNRRLSFILSVCVESKANTPADVLHFSMVLDGKSWSLLQLRRKKIVGTSKSGSQMERVQDKNFASVTDLVAYYQKTRIFKNVMLKTPIPRPKWIIPTSYIHFVKNELGKGNFAKVVKAHMFKPDKNGNHGKIYVAVKILLESDTEGTTEQEREEGRDLMMREAKVMQKYKHNNVVKFFGVACDKPPISLVLEFCPGGSLEGHLKKLGDKIPASELVQYVLESARGLRYLHHHNCIHRDLAARNCLISADGFVKIADFGLSKVFDKNDIGEDEDKINQNVPLRWMAPETISRQPRFSSKSDIWSFGVMCFEIFNNGTKPWADVDQLKVISRAIRTGNMPTPPSKTPTSIVSMMKDCWNLQMSERPEFIDIIKIVLQIQEKEAPLKPPKASEFTVNTIPGVTRLEKNETAEDIVGMKSVDLLNSIREKSDREKKSDESKDSKETKTKSKESKESKETVEEHKIKDSTAKRKNTKLVPAVNKKIPTST